MSSGVSSAPARRDRWVLPLGSAGRDGWDVLVDASEPGWSHTGLYVARLGDGDRRTISGAGWEHVVVPLSGSAVVLAGGDEVALAGRPSVFSGPTDIAFVPAGLDLTVQAVGEAKVSVCAARVAAAAAGSGGATDLPTHRDGIRHLPVSEVPVELRGAGSASREVRNFAVPGVLDAESIIACEVITPAGNWSSYPPHKHDEDRPGRETQLEEIYYYELSPTAGAPESAGAPIGYQRVYGTDGRPIDVLAEVGTGDVVLVPYGWHGPAMAPPGYDLYYLNVMAGPGPERAWLITDDPVHAWVRGTWPDQAVDPRLPLGGPR